MKRIITGALLALALFVSMLVGGTAAYAAGIVCSVSKLTITSRTATVTIKSNKRIVYGQTSMYARYVGTNLAIYTITLDDGYGATIRATRPVKSREWASFTPFHAGTKCKTKEVSGGL